VGKGLTFDSGGYNLKTAGSQIEMMKYDMGGSAAVLGAARALGQRRPEGVEVHVIVAACENMISGDAIHPGDVLTASNGKTIEVNNTDAEGRLTLADALIYACRLEPDVVVDLATLTGACVIALGEEIAGLWTPEDGLAEALVSAANGAGESLWRMPLRSSYREGLKSHVASRSCPRPLEALLAQRQHQGVAPSRLRGVQGLDGGAFVDHALVIQQQRAPGLGQGEAHALRAAGVEDAGLRTLDVVARHQHHRHQVHPVAVGAFGRGAADAIGAVDAKGVGLTKPAPAPRAKTCGTHGQRLQQCGKGRRLGHGRGHGLEPALDAAVQGVVFHRLPVGAVRHLGHLPALHHKTAVTAAPIAAAVTQVGVGREIVPERLQGLQIGRRSARPAAEGGGVQHRKAGRGQLRLQVRQRGQRRRGRHAAA
jgi:hypothetical protein